MYYRSHSPAGFSDPRGRSNFSRGLHLNDLGITSYAPRNRSVQRVINSDFSRRDRSRSPTRDYSTSHITPTRPLPNVLTGDVSPVPRRRDLGLTSHDVNDSLVPTTSWRADDYSYKKPKSYYEIPSSTPRYTSYSTSLGIKRPQRTDYSDYLLPVLQSRPTLKANYVPRPRTERENIVEPLVRERKLIKFREITNDILTRVRRKISWDLDGEIYSPLINEMKKKEVHIENINDRVKSRESSLNRQGSRKSLSNTPESRSPTIMSRRSSDQSIERMSPRNLMRLRSPRTSTDNSFESNELQLLPIPPPRKKSLGSSRRVKKSRKSSLEHSDIDEKHLHHSLIADQILRRRQTSDASKSTLDRVGRTEQILDGSGGKSASETALDVNQCNQLEINDTIERRRRTEDSITPEEQTDDSRSRGRSRYRTHCEPESSQQTSTSSDIPIPANRMHRKSVKYKSNDGTHRHVSKNLEESSTRKLSPSIPETFETDLNEESLIKNEKFQTLLKENTTRVHKIVHDKRQSEDSLDQVLLEDQKRKNISKIPTEGLQSFDTNTNECKQKNDIHIMADKKLITLNKNDEPSVCQIDKAKNENLTDINRTQHLDAGNDLIDKNAKLTESESHSKLKSSLKIDNLKNQKHEKKSLSNSNRIEVNNLQGKSLHEIQNVGLKKKNEPYSITDNSSNHENKLNKLNVSDTPIVIKHLKGNKNEKQNLLTKDNNVKYNLKEGEQKNSNFINNISSKDKISKNDKVSILSEIPSGKSFVNSQTPPNSTSQIEISDKEKNILLDDYPRKKLVKAIPSAVNNEISKNDKSLLIPDNTYKSQTKAISTPTTDQNILVKKSELEKIANNKTEKPKPTNLSNNENILTKPECDKSKSTVEFNDINKKAEDILSKNVTSTEQNYKDCAFSKKISKFDINSEQIEKTRINETDKYKKLDLEQNLKTSIINDKNNLQPKPKKIIYFDLSTSNDVQSSCLNNHGKITDLNKELGLPKSLELNSKTGNTLNLKESNIAKNFSKKESLQNLLVDEVKIKDQVDVVVVCKLPQPKNKVNTTFSSPANEITVTIPIDKKTSKIPSKLEDKTLKEKHEKQILKKSSNQSVTPNKVTSDMDIPSILSEPFNSTKGSIGLSPTKDLGLEVNVSHTVILKPKNQNLKPAVEIEKDFAESSGVHLKSIPDVVQSTIKVKNEDKKSVNVIKSLDADKGMNIASNKYPIKNTPLDSVNCNEFNLSQLKTSIIPDVARSTNLSLDKNISSGLQSTNGAISSKISNNLVNQNSAKQKTENVSSPKGTTTESSDKIGDNEIENKSLFSDVGRKQNLKASLKRPARRAKTSENLDLKVSKNENDYKSVKDLKTVKSIEKITAKCYRRSSTAPTVESIISVAESKMLKKTHLSSDVGSLVKPIQPENITKLEKNESVEYEHKKEKNISKVYDKDKDTVLKLIEPKINSGVEEPQQKSKNIEFGKKSHIVDQKIVSKMNCQKSENDEKLSLVEESKSAITSEVIQQKQKNLFSKSKASLEEPNKTNSKIISKTDSCLKLFDKSENLLPETKSLNRKNSISIQEKPVVKSDQKVHFASTESKEHRANEVSKNNLQNKLSSNKSENISKISSIEKDKKILESNNSNESSSPLTDIPKTSKEKDCHSKTIKSSDESSIAVINIPKKMEEKDDHSKTKKPSNESSMPVVNISRDSEEKDDHSKISKPPTVSKIKSVDKFGTDVPPKKNIPIFNVSIKDHSSINQVTTDVNENTCDKKNSDKAKHIAFKCDDLSKDSKERKVMDLQKITDQRRDSDQNTKVVNKRAKPFSQKPKKTSDLPPVSPRPTRYGLVLALNPKHMYSSSSEEDSESWDSSSSVSSLSDENNSDDKNINEQQNGNSLERNPAKNKDKFPASNISTILASVDLEDSTNGSERVETHNNVNQTFSSSPSTKPKFQEYSLNDFQILKLLGKGSFGKVLLAELKGHDMFFAVKCLKKDVILQEDDIESAIIERKVLKLGTEHPYLCKLFCTFQSEIYLFYVMEYFNGGDLMFHIQNGRFDEKRSMFYGAEIVSALKFLHKKGIVYRDIKLDNVMLDQDGHIHLVDFGMCQFHMYDEECMSYNFCGTPNYIAPEILYGHEYNQSVDWWSFGVLLFEMILGRSPFVGTDEDELFWSICHEEPSYSQFLSKDAKDILQKLLIKIPEERLGMPRSPAGDIKGHPFFSSIDWDKIERKEIPPPFKPTVFSASDTRNFDQNFTLNSPSLSPVNSAILRTVDQRLFDGFTYTNPHLV